MSFNSTIRLPTDNQIDSAIINFMFKMEAENRYYELTRKNLPLIIFAFTGIRIPESDETTVKRILSRVIPAINKKLCLSF